MTTIAAPEADPAETILSVNNIEVIYDHVILVLKGVSLSVPRGGITALLGANGAGKTTTLKAISNLLHAERGEVTKGSIVFEGEEVQALSPNDLVRRGCIQVMEGRHCFGHLSVEDNLLTGAFTRRDGAAAIRDDLELVYNYFPRLKVRRSSMAGYTSGGEQQMTAIGRALMSRPKMILLDEPSMGLAPQLVEAGRLLPAGRAEHQYRAALRQIRLYSRIGPHRARRRGGRAARERGCEGVLSRRRRRGAQVVPRRQALQAPQALAGLNGGSSFLRRRPLPPLPFATVFAISGHQAMRRDIRPWQTTPLTAPSNSAPRWTIPSTKRPSGFSSASPNM
jgi:ABC-type branched-subunit amino acid transport system ATPase component